MKYRITFTTGHSIEIEGDQIDDNGLQTIIKKGAGKMVYHGPHIESIESVDDIEVTAGNMNDYGGYCLFDDGGEMIMAIRKKGE